VWLKPRPVPGLPQVDRRLELTRHVAQSGAPTLVSGLSQSHRPTTDYDMTGMATFPIRHSRAGGNLG